MPDLPTYGNCDCGGRMVLDLETANKTLVKFRCDEDGCDWARMMTQARFRSLVESADDVDLDDLRARARGGVPA